MSELRTAIEEYLDLRRALGFKLRDTGYMLNNFAAFAEREGTDFITTKLALRWATQLANFHPAYGARRLGALRLFARYRSTTDPRTEIPPDGLLPYYYHRKPPYIFSDDEILRLIRAAEKLPSPRGLRATTYSTLFGLIAVTGMRRGEPIALDRQDVDLTRGILTIRHAKFNKSRLVLLHPSTTDALRRYEHLRNIIFPQPKTSGFFVSEREARLRAGAVHWTFVKLSRQIGLRGPTDSHGPRIHDLRHRFAIRTLTNWYRAGIDIDRHMSELTTHLGHRHVTGTYWYLSATPELLRLATLRMENTEGGPSS